jgi:3-oxoacyl-[acyl-carrier-protein] synthase II
MARRVVITAMGMVTSLGDTPEDLARRVRSGQTTFQYFGTDPRVVAAPVEDFEVQRHAGRFKNRRYLTRGAALAVSAAVRAASRAALPSSQWESAGLFVGAGPNLDLGGECPSIQQGAMDAEKLSALWMLRFLPNTAAAVIAQLTGVRGENLTVGSACAASLQAVGEAYRKIRDGYLTVALAGGGDSRLSSGALLAYLKARALYQGSGPPGEAQRPFDQLRSGFVPGEGGAFFVLEDARHAEERRAKVLAEICGYGASMDGDAMTAPRPDGRWAETAVRRALEQGRLQPQEVALIAAHGTGTWLNDEMEARMIQRIFHRHRPWVLALKSWVGHLAAACGAVELALCLSSMQTGIWPWIRNLEAPCNPDLNYLRSSGSLGVPGNILLENFGFGGQNAALVIRPWQP